MSDDQDRIRSKTCWPSSRTANILLDLDQLRQTNPTLSRSLESSSTVSLTRDAMGNLIIKPKTNQILSQGTPSSQSDSTETDGSTTFKQRKNPRGVTVDSYRKYVGLGSLQPLPGSSSSSRQNFKTSEANVGLSVQMAPCRHCRFMELITASHCRRCKRRIDEQNSPQTENHLQITSAIPARSFYGKSPESSGEQNSAVRTLQSKNEAPQCVTIYSDEEEEEENIQNNIQPKSVKQNNSTVLQDSQESVQVVEKNVKTKRLFQYLPLVFSESEICPEPQLKKSKENSFPAAESQESVELIEMPLVNEETSEVNEINESRESEILDVDRWKNAEIEGLYIALDCVSVWIGSYHAVPKEWVLFYNFGLKMQVPVRDEQTNLPSDKETASLFVTETEILHIKVHFGRNLPVILILISPSCAAKMRRRLNLTDRSGSFFCPQSGNDTMRYLVILLKSVGEEVKPTLQDFYKNMVEELDFENAKKKLMSCALPGEIVVARTETQTNSNQLSEKVTEKETGTATKENLANLESLGVQVIFRWLDSHSVTTEDYLCLNSGEFLNDNIIDFYLSYLCQTKLDEVSREKYHIFSSFFYNRLSTKPTRSRDPIENDPGLTAAEKRHHRVKSWTKRVNLFDKDFVVIPINQNVHWFLAIICFPGLDGPRTMKDDKPVQVSHINSKTESSSVENNEPSLWDDLDMDWNSLDERDNNHSASIKQPCILVLDSLAGASHVPVINTLREYLRIEYREKVGDPEAATRLFSKKAIPGITLEVPQQPNYSDCGIYVLQYFESFLTDPITDYRLPLPDYRSWFPESTVRRKRSEIQQLLLNLMDGSNPTDGSEPQNQNRESLRSLLRAVTVQESSASITETQDPIIKPDSSPAQGLLPSDSSDGPQSPVLCKRSQGNVKNP